MPENTKSLAIVQSIIDPGKNLNLTVIAEGIETVNNKDTPIKLGCHIVQGYLYSRPKLPKEILNHYTHVSLTKA
jgi:EAL domain-containing protein (putative c-di-GMP-specific phosphodiesterase class I)